MTRIIGFVLAAALVVLVAPPRAQARTLEVEGIASENLRAEATVRRPLGAVLTIPAASLGGLYQANLKQYRITELQVSRLEPYGGASTAVTVSLSPRPTTATTQSGSTLFLRVPEDSLAEIAQMNGEAVRFLGRVEELVNDRRKSWAVLEVTDSGAIYEPLQQYWVVPRQMLPRFRAVNRRTYRVVHEAQWRCGGELLRVAVVALSPRDLFGFRLPAEDAPTLVRLNLGQGMDVSSHPTTASETETR
jgi:hypothetical protein